MNLRLVLELTRLGRPLMVALNMADVARSQGLAIDVARLSAELGCPVVETVAVKHDGHAGLLALLQSQLGDVLPAAAAQASVPEARSSADLQTEVRRILIQRRDAHDALRAKEDAEREAARARYRAEHERIDDDSSTKLRKLLGEDGYRALAQWLVAPRGKGPERPRGPHPGTRSNDPAAALPFGPDPDEPEPQSRVR